MAWLILREYWRAKDRQLELQHRHAPKQLVAALEDEKKQLEARIQNLESIVCSVDFELNQRLSRLAAAQTAASDSQPKLAGRGSISSPGSSGGVAVAVRSASAVHQAASAAIVEATGPTAVLST